MSTLNSYLYEADGLGSITSLTNTTGAVSQAYNYDSFGKTTVLTPNSIGDSFRYTAREFDSETGLYYYRARYYLPELGRFLSEDPIGFDQGPNLYKYVGNNPATFVDPSGMQACNFPIIPKNPTKRRPPTLTTCPSKDLIDCLLNSGERSKANQVSPKGARGRWQVTPVTIRELQQQGLLGKKYNLDQAGLTYLELLLTSCDSVTDAVAAYNAGPDAVNSADGVPDFPETTDYVKRIDDCLKKKGNAAGLEDNGATTCCKK